LIGFRQAMPDRLKRYGALILRAKDSPAGHRILSLLTAEEGIIDVFLFGGAKSSLRSSATPFVAAQAFVYSDPVKHYRKLNDLVILESFQGLRESYAKLWSASVMAEIAIKTQGCGGEYQTLLALCLSLLRALDLAAEEEVEIKLLAFLWKSLGIMGLQPDWSRCVVCGNRIQPRKGEPLSSPILYYSPRLDGFACPDCGAEGLGLGAEDIDLLDRLGTAKIQDCGRSARGSRNLDSLRSLLYYLSQKAAEGVLLSLEIDPALTPGQK
jgi:DNA repair protein RecO